MEQRTEDILRELIKDPSLSYSDLAERYGLRGRQAVRNMVARHMHKLAPGWVKARRKRPVRDCQAAGCNNRFRETRSYSGPSAKYCQDHRGKVRQVKPG